MSIATGERPIRPGIVPDGDGAVHIRIRDLRKRFGPNKVLRGVDLDVRRGETLVVLGGSGSGKTTLFKHLMGTQVGDRGSIRVDGWELGEMRPRDWSAYRQRLGVVFQHAALLGSLTVEENVGLSLIEVQRLPRDEVRRRVLRALRQVFLPGKEILDLLPEGLSGGMRKRVGLARAIIQEPDLILYDEPTSGLDPVTVSGVDELILEMQRTLDVTSVVITHDIASAFRIADRIAMLYEGRIIACGSPDEIREDDHPALVQLLEGRTEGPLTETMLNRTSSTDDDAEVTA